MEEDNILSDELTPQQLMFFETFFQNNFNVNKTCLAMGIHFSVVYNRWMKQDAFKLKYDEVRLTLLSKAEEVLYTHLNKDSLQAAMFVLERLGKKDGWGQSIDLTSKGLSFKPAIIHISEKANSIISDQNLLDD